MKLQNSSVIISGGNSGLGIMRAVIALILFSGLWNPILTMAGNDTKEHQHKHEISIAPGISYVSHNDGFFPSFHLEYTYGFGLRQLQFSAGIYGEAIFTKHIHYSVGLTMGFMPLPGLTLHAGPGVTFDDGEIFMKGSASIAYEFHLNRLIFGPMTEYAFHKGDYHVTFGLFFGITF